MNTIYHVYIWYSALDVSPFSVLYRMESVLGNCFIWFLPLNSLSVHYGINWNITPTALTLGTPTLRFRRNFLPRTTKKYMGTCKIASTSSYILKAGEALVTNISSIIWSHERQWYLTIPCFSHEKKINFYWLFLLFVWKKTIALFLLTYVNDHD